MAETSLHAICEQARRLLEQNDTERAIAVAQHILEYFPDNLETHRILGEAYLASRQFDQAEEAFTRVLNSDPENIPALVGLGITYERQGKLDRAVSEFEQALEIKPDMPELRSQLLRLYTDAWGSEGAQLRLSRAGLARLYAKGHMLPQAIQEFRSVIAEHPERFDARVGLAEVLWRDGQEHAAASTCDEIISERGDVLKANLLLGYIKLASGNPEGSRYWSVAQQLDPYQGVARALFDTLPSVEEPHTTLPEWDEAVWQEQRVRDEQERRAREEEEQELRELEEDRASETPVVFSELDESGWMETIEPSQPVSAAEMDVSPPRSQADEDFLASLLAFEGLDKDELAEVLGESGDISSSSVDDAQSEVTPFSIDDIQAEIAKLDAIESSAETGTDSLSLDSLGLSDEEIAALNEAVTPTADDQPALSSADLVGPESAAADVEPFSLESLGLEEEVDQSGTAERPTGPEASRDFPDIEPFDWSLDVPPPDESVSREAGEASSEADILPDLQPFSLDDLDLSVADTGREPSDIDEGSLPPSLQPFSLEDIGDISPTPPPSGRDFDTPTSMFLPREENEEDVDEPVAFGWQQPASKSGTDFIRRSEEPEEPQDNSIFAKLKQRRQEIPAEEELPLSSMEIEDEESSGFFSDDDVSLREEDLSAADMTTADETPTMDEGTADLKPFTLEELGLTEEEITSINMAEQVEVSPEMATDTAPPAEPAPPDTPELTPFSLEELGLTEEEIASLGLDMDVPQTSGTTELPAETRSTEDQSAFAEEEPDLAPFSLDDLGLEEEVPSEEDRQAELPEATPGTSASEFDDISEGLGDIQPFSLEDLGLEDEIASFNFESSSMKNEGELGITEDELANLDLGAFGSSIPSGGRRVPGAMETASGQAAGSGATGDPALDKLMSLGRRQGFVDLNDIIEVVENPVEQPERIEEIGQALHLAGIEIRDGDEVINMDEEEFGEEYTDDIAVLDAGELQTGAVQEEPELTPFSLEDLGLTDEEIEAIGKLQGEQEASPAEAASAEAEVSASTPAPVEEEPELKPFSLAELGLSPEEIAALDAAAGAPPSEAAESAPPAPDAEPELKPFSLAELGLSPEEIAALNEAEGTAQSTAGEQVQPEDIDAFDFSVVDQHRDEVKPSAQPAEHLQLEEVPTASPEDAAFTPEPLENLDDIWDVPAGSTPESAPSARSAETSSAVATKVPVARETVPVQSRPQEPAKPRDRSAPAPASIPEKPRRGVSRHKLLADFIPTGDATLDGYLRQVEAEPDNHGLHLAIARLSAKTGHYDLALFEYKHLIKSKTLLDQIVDDLQELIEESEEKMLLQRLHRLLGDAYSEQNRFREAIAAYSWTFTS